MLTILGLFATLSSASADDSVSFTLNIHQGSFLKERPVMITILDSEQLRRVAENNDCVTAIDRHGNTEHVCMDGHTPLEIEAETFTIAYRDLGQPVVLTSRTVSPGEAYSISVNGEASDRCNTSGGGHTGVATAQVSLKPAIWTTEMACLHR